MLTFSYAQDNADSALNTALRFRGLKSSDVTIPVNFDKEKSPFNDSKLLMPAVKNLMTEPLSSFRFTESIDSLKDLDFKELINKLYSYKRFNPQKKAVDLPDFVKFNSADLEKYIIKLIKKKRHEKEKLLKVFSNEEQVFLEKNLLSIISETDKDDGSNTDIFRFNRSRDSSIAVSKRTLDILSKESYLNASGENIIDACICFGIFTAVYGNPGIFSETDYIKDENAEGDFYFYYNEDGIRIAIGGKGKNVYKSVFDFIIDTGGDDVYSSYSAGKTNMPFERNNFSCIIDLSGNDFYGSGRDFTLAGSVFSSSFIFDKSGDDVYKGRNVSLGASVGGIGLLYDLNGNDIYQANQFSSGASAFGVGLLYDIGGNDTYIANSYSQGFGMTEGVGAILDKSGNDSYLIDARSLDIGRYEDHYISMSQGYGLGLRPYYAGGIGLIIECGGNDIYNTDIFGQGGAYWYGTGCISDIDGNDKYNSYQYAQGAGIHLAVGILKDNIGWDFYSSNGVSQGCGHDFGFGFLYDRAGNDNYSAYSLSQGAGNANGIGLFIDGSGRDGYLNKEPGNTRGYGNSRREYGSLGFFIDVSGDDYYSTGGMDSVISNSSMWGVMTDFYFKDQENVSGSSGFKINVDSSKSYTQEEYFIMAKTLEPRFSLWQEYGFRKLADDSLNTPEFLLKFLDTDDHRAGLVLRNLAFRIGYTMGNFFTEKLNYYLNSAKAQDVFNENEIAFICYLFGETRNPAGREQLLELTFDENTRIRSSAVNALGKIKTDSSDTDFTLRTAKRLRELAMQKSELKMFNKDIAYAFKNYRADNNIPVLIEMMRYDYFGVRFPAADALKDYKDIYLNYLNTETIERICSDEIWFLSFLNSVENISDDNFINLYSEIRKSLPSDNDITDFCLTELLKKKKSESVNEYFIEWADNEAISLSIFEHLKVK